MSGGLSLASAGARDASGVKGAPRGLVYGVTLELASGLVCFLGTPEDGSVALAECLVGRRAADRGTVAVAGRDPFRAPDVRARIGYVGIEPALPFASSVSAAVALAVAAWSAPPTPASVLEKAGLTQLASRRVSELSPAEQRAVEWALLLALPSPALAVVFEPFTDLAGLPTAAVERELGALAARVPVIVFTSSPADARRFERVAVLHRGAVVRDSRGPHGSLGTGRAAALSVWAASGSRALAAALLESTAVTSVAFDDAAPAAGGSAATAVIRVTGDDRAALALALADALVASGADVVALSEVAPGLAEVHAQTEYEIRSRQLETERLRLLEMRGAAERAAVVSQWPGAPGFQHTPFGSAAPMPVVGPPPPSSLSANTPSVPDVPAIATPSDTAAKADADDQGPAR